MQIRQTSNSPEETELLAEKIGELLKGGEVIELTSDLGGGKTTFVRGLARGFGSKDRVTSPTFTISKVYKNSKKTLHHFDFYRLPEAGLMSYELEEILGDQDSVVVIEWSSVVQDVLPDKRLSIMIQRTKEDGREITLRYPEELAYLAEGLQT